MTASADQRGDAIRHVEAKTSAVVLVCRKCSKKLDGGFGIGGHERLAKVLRRSLGPKVKPRRATVAIVEVGCLDLCPKNAVVVLHSERPGDWLVVPRGTSIDTLEALLGLPVPHSEPEA